MNHKIELFLDSGAFSAHTQNKPIDINEYIAFIKENQNYISLYANLDVIGDADATWKNQKIMEEAGLNPLPIFHYGEDFKWLVRYMNKYDYFALGGIAKAKTQQRIKWLDDCFNMICDSSGMPKHKVHGFGMTSIPLILRYPWYSVDSTSWQVLAGKGGIFVPAIKNGKYVYDEDCRKILVSFRSSYIKKLGEHISTLSPTIRKKIMEYIESKGYGMGKSEYKIESESYELKENEKWTGPAVNGKREVEILIEKGLGNYYLHREEMNILFFQDLENSIPPWPCPMKIKRQSRFGI